MELEPSSTTYVPPAADRRPHMPEPPPVRLVAIEDVIVVADPRLGSVQLGLNGPRKLGAEAISGILDEFYVDLLRFEREIVTSSPAPRRRECDLTDLVYKAENHRLVIRIADCPQGRPDMRPTGIEVPALAEVERLLVEREIEFERLRGLIAGSDTLVFRDPLGILIAATEMRRSA